MATRESTLRYFFSRIASGWLILLLAAVPVVAQDQPPAGRMKSIRGVVRDLRGEPIRGARVFVRNLDTNVIRTLTTGGDGIYSVSGLPMEVSYEVSAEFRGVESEKRLVSGFLDRTDNVLHFQLDVAVIPNGAASTGADEGFVLETFDRVQLRASFQMPTGLPAPIPAALLLHGWGESRAVWQDLEDRLLEEGWAVMAIDLRGHGRSRLRNRETIAAEEAWRRDSRQFPLDVEPALRWMQSQPRLDGTRIAVIGSGLGANLALVASGRYREVATVVAIDPDLEEAIALAGTAREFSPQTVHLIVNDPAEGDRLREQVRGISRVTVMPAGGGTAAWLATRDTIDEIVRWLRDTY